MKATGIVRRVDELGRVVIPIELRRLHGMQEKDGLEIFVDGDTVILRKYEPNCVFCGESDGAMRFKGRLICAECKTQLQQHRL